MYYRNHVLGKTENNRMTLDQDRRFTSQYSNRALLWINYKCSDSVTSLSYFRVHACVVTSNSWCNGQHTISAYTVSWRRRPSYRPMCTADWTHISPASDVITCRDPRGKLTNLPLLQIFYCVMPTGLFSSSIMDSNSHCVSQHRYVKFTHKSPSLRHRILRTTRTLTPPFLTYN